MSEYFNAEVNIGKKGNSIERVSLYACSGSTEATCDPTPISGYNNILWTDVKFLQTFESGSYPSLSGLITFITGLTLYTHTYIKVLSTSSYNGSCVISRMIPIIGIPTPTPTPTSTPIPTVTPTPTPAPTSTPTSTPTVTPIPCSFDGTVVYGLPTTPTPTPTPTSITPTDTPTPTPTVTPGQCYTYTLDHVSDTAFGVSYGMVGVGTQISLFNSIPSIETSLGSGVFTYSICSDVEPTLLDTSNWPVYYPTGYSSGISRSGPNGPCSNNFDCYTN